MSMTKGTPLSSQIIWLEERVKELEEICFEQKNELISIKRGQYFKENEKLKEEINKLENKNHSHENFWRVREHRLLNDISGLKEEIDQLKSNKPESDKIENILMDSLDARYKKQVEKMSYSGDGIYTAKRAAAVYLVEELVDEVIKSSYDDNQIKLAYAIELLKKSQS